MINILTLWIQLLLQIILTSLTLFMLITIQLCTCLLILLLVSIPFIKRVSNLHIQCRDLRLKYINILPKLWFHLLKLLTMIFTFWWWCNWLFESLGLVVLLSKDWNELRKLMLLIVNKFLCLDHFGCLLCFCLNFFNWVVSCIPFSHSWFPKLNLAITKPCCCTCSFILWKWWNISCISCCSLSDVLLWICQLRSLYLLHSIFVIELFLWLLNLLFYGVFHMAFLWI